MLDAWYDPIADGYSPQVDDVVIIDADVVDGDNIYLIYVDVSDAGSANSANSEMRKLVDNSQSLYGAHLGPDPSDRPACGGGEGPGEPIDRILVVASQFLQTTFNWRRFTVFRRGMDSLGGGNSSLARGLRVGQIFITAEALAELSAATMNNTILHALRDINQFRAIGDHIVDSPGSAIPWQRARVNWNNYGAGDPNLSNRDILDNLINALCCD